MQINYDVLSTHQQKINIFLYVGILMFIIPVSFYLFSDLTVSFFDWFASLSTTQNDLTWLSGYFYMLFPLAFISSFFYKMYIKKRILFERSFGLNLQSVNLCVDRIYFFFTQQKYDIVTRYEDIKNLKMVLHVYSHKTKNSGTSYSVEEIELIFTLFDDREYSITTIPHNKMQFIYSIIDYSRSMQNFSYEFSGSCELIYIKEKINSYLETARKDIVTNSDVKKAALLLFFFGFFELNSIMILWDNKPKGNEIFFDAIFVLIPIPFILYSLYKIFSKYFNQNNI